MKTAITQLIDQLTIYVLYPISLFMVGTTIHLINLYLLLTGGMQFSLWVLWVNLFMLVFNSAMLIGLLRRETWAIVISTVGFILQTATWIGYSIISGDTNLSTTAGIILCLAAIPVLIYIHQRQKLVSRQKADRSLHSSGN